MEYEPKYLDVFESDVILYGGQTRYTFITPSLAFESDVILYGGQTFASETRRPI